MDHTLTSGSVQTIHINTKFQGNRGDEVQLVPRTAGTDYPLLWSVILLGENLRVRICLGVHHYGDIRVRWRM